MVEEKAEQTKNVFAVGALVTSNLIAEQRLTLTEDLRYLHPEEKVLKVVRKKSKKHRKTCHWGPLIWWSFEVLSDHNDTEEDDVVDWDWRHAV